MKLSFSENIVKFNKHSIFLFVRPMGKLCAKQYIFKPLIKLASNLFKMREYTFIFVADFLCYCSL